MIEIVFLILSHNGKDCIIFPRTLHFLATTCPAGSPACIGCLIDELLSDNSGVVSSEVSAAIPL
jgi:hypothetical protein